MVAGVELVYVGRRMQSGLVEIQIHTLCSATWLAGLFTLLLQCRVAGGSLWSGASRRALRGDWYGIRRPSHHKHRGRQRSQPDRRFSGCYGAIIGCRLRSIVMRLCSCVGGDLGLGAWGW